MGSSPSWFQHHKADLLIIGMLAILTLATRLPIAAERKIMPAGDAFNFQHIATHIQYGSYPPKEKRLPTYSVFILAGRTLGLDPIKTSIAISLIASTGTIIALYSLGRVFNFNRAGLVGALGLAMFDPLLVINGIRPLSDGLFVCLVATTYFFTALFMQHPHAATPTRRKIYSVILTMLMFTRYEGFLIAGLTAPFLFIKLPFKQVLRMAILPTIAVILWIPAYRAIHGSISGLSYVTDATNPGGGFGELTLLPENFGRLMNGAGWKRIWTYPEEVFEKEVTSETVGILIKNPNWWAGILSAIGLLFLLIRGRFAGFSILLAAVGYALLLSWWWVYSRYVAPLSILFYFGIAGGISLVTYSTTVLMKKLKWRTGAALAALVPLISIPIMVDQIPRLHASSLSQAWESNRKGYSLYQALLFAAHQDGVTVYPTKEHANATLFFGDLTQPKSKRNPHKGIYLSDWPTLSAESLYGELTQAKPRYFIETDFDSRIPHLVTLLKQNQVISQTHVFSNTQWDTLDQEVINVYELTWTK